MTPTVTPLAPKIGAEISGIDLTQSLDRDTAGLLTQAFIDHAVLVVRGQSLQPQEFLAVARQFGTPVRQHLEQFNIADCPDVSTISNQEKTKTGEINVRGVSWHTDHSFTPEPPKATMLYSVALPDTGGNTHWAHMGAAYEALTPELRVRVDGLSAVHAYTDSRVPPDLAERKREEAESVTDGVAHPLARTHPESGRKAIYLNPLRVRRFLGMVPEDCSGLIGDLVAHATQPEFTYTHQWQLGDMVIWDNRCCMHKADTDYDFNQQRLMYRIILAGDKPF